MLSRILFRDVYFIIITVVILREFIYLFKEYLFSIYYVSSTVLNSGDTIIKKQIKIHLWQFKKSQIAKTILKI